MGSMYFRTCRVPLYLVLVLLQLVPLQPPLVHAQDAPATSTTTTTTNSNYLVGRLPSELAPFAGEPQMVPLMALMDDHMNGVSMDRSVVNRTRMHRVLEQSFSIYADSRLLPAKIMTVSSLNETFFAKMDKTQQEHGKADQRVTPSAEFLRQASLGVLAELHSVRGISHDSQSDSNEALGEQQPQQVTLSQFEDYMEATLRNQSLAVYPSLCDALRSRIEACATPSPSPSNTTTTTSTINPSMMRTVLERMTPFLTHCYSGMTALASWRMERCVFTPEPGNCAASLNCFLSPREQRKFRTWSVSASVGLSNTPAGSDTTSTSTTTTTGGLHFTNITSMDPKQFGMGLLWSTILMEGIEEKLGRMPWLPHGMQTTLNIVFSTLLGIVCLPCAAMSASTLVQEEVEELTAEDVIPHSTVQKDEALVNATMIQYIFD